MNRRGTRRAQVAGIAGAMALTVAACGDDAPTASTPTGAPGVSAPSTTDPTTTAPGKPVSDADRAQAAAAVVTFVDALGAGDVERAAAILGPVSIANAASAGGVAALLRQSTEGHGAWIGASDRTVTAAGAAPDVAVVVLQGTLQVEGMTERRVAAFPVARSAPDQPWLVEPWGMPLASDGPLTVLAPPIGVDGRVAHARDGATTSRVTSAAAGRVHVLVDEQPVAIETVTAGGELSVDVPAGALLVTLLLQGDDGTLSAVAFGVRPPVNGAAASITVPFLSDATNDLLRSCASGDAGSCDAAQIPGVLDDGAFSFFHVRCDGGDAAYCTLFDNLVAAELRIHDRTPTSSGR